MMVVLGEFYKVLEQQKFDSSSFKSGLVFGKKICSSLNHVGENIAN